MLRAEVSIDGTVWFYRDVPVSLSVSRTREVFTSYPVWVSVEHEGAVGSYKYILAHPIIPN